MNNYKMEIGLSKNNKNLLKGIQRYFNKIQNLNFETAVGDVVINDKKYRILSRNISISSIQ